MKRRLLPLVILWIMTFVITPHTGLAQSFSRLQDTETNVTSYYHFVQPGAATVQVYVIGAVGSPGIYEVSQGTDLTKLLALARSTVSGTSIANSWDGEAQHRNSLVRVYRQEGSARRTVFESTLEDAIVAGSNNVAMQDGDVLMVETRVKSRFTWRDALRIVQVVGVGALAVDRLMN